MANLSRPILSLKRASPLSSAKPAPVPAPALSRFYFVWAPDGQRPKRRHASAEAAHAEAARLRGIAPERRFHVFEAHRIDIDGTVL
jgi:hypothetical protein